MADMEVLAPGGHQHLVDKIKEQLAMKADASLASAVEKVIENQPTAVLSGTVLTAADAYAEPPVALTVDGKSTQDGTPTPESPVEIVSLEQVGLTFAGKNLIGVSAGVTYTYNSITLTSTDGAVIVSTDNSSNLTRTFLLNLVDGTISGGSNWYPANYTISERNSIPLPAGTYRFTNTGTTSNGVRVGLVHGHIGDHKDPTYAATFTTDGTERAMLLCYVNSRASLYTAGPQTIQYQLEVGSVTTAYEPYIGTSVLLNLTQALRSLPDGTRDTLSFAYLQSSTREGWAWYSGELTRRIHHEVITEFDQRSVASSGGYRSTRGEKKIPSAVVNSATKGRCSHAPWTNSSSSTATSVNRICAYRANSVSNILCVVLTTDNTDENFTTLENMNAWLATHGPIAVDCELVTPVTTQLDPIELPVLPAPECTVWSDPATGLQMRYVRDMQIVIDSLNSEIERAYAAIAPVESTTAKSNHAVGDYLMLGGTLCKVTSAIASGEAIAIGTNVAATTVDTELASLE